MTDQQIADLFAVIDNAKDCIITLRHQRDEARAALAECYRLTGADHLTAYSARGARCSASSLWLRDSTGQEIELLWQAKRAAEARVRDLEGRIANALL